VTTLQSHGFIWHSQKQTDGTAIMGNIAHLLSLLARAMQTREEQFMTNRFMISCRGGADRRTGFANAQGTGTSRERRRRLHRPTERASEHGNSAAPSNRNAAEPRVLRSGMKATQSEEVTGAARTSAPKTRHARSKVESMSSESEGAKGWKDIERLKARRP